MAWFVYNFPRNPLSPCSYTFVAAAPNCNGNTLCAVNTDIVPDSFPVKPDLEKEGIEAAINNALIGTITPGVTLLRMG